MDKVERLERVQLRETAWLRTRQAELDEHRRLAPRKQVYWDYRSLGSTAAVIAYLEDKVARLHERIERRQAKIDRAKTGTSEPGPRSWRRSSTTR